MKMNTSARNPYARTSKTDRNLGAQIVALGAAGCTMIRTNQRSGVRLEGRAELTTILDFIHEGETLLSTRIDRLGRSLADLLTIVTRLADKGAHLAATQQPVDTSTAAGKSFFDMLGFFAEIETNLHRERQAEGMTATKERGVHKGRPPKIDIDVIKARLAEGETPTESACILGVSRGKFYKAKAQIAFSSPGLGR